MANDIYPASRVLSYTTINIKHYLPVIIICYSSKINNPKDLKCNIPSTMDEMMNVQV